MKPLLLLFTIIINLLANDSYSLRSFYGKASQRDLYEILTGDITTQQIHYSVISLDFGDKIDENFLKLPIELYRKIGFSYLNDGKGADAYEITLYIKSYWNFFGDRVRFGFGEGLSYINSIIATEYLEAVEKNGKNSKFLNYLDISIDLNIEDIFASHYCKDTYIGAGIKHRSGIFGLINNVKHGGSNYNGLYIEKKF